MSVYYTREHEWIRVEGDIGTIGITKFAAQELGEVVFVELPEVGRSFEASAELGTIESVKAVAEVYAPVSGVVTEVNNGVVDSPDLLNDDPEGEGWLLKLRLTSPDEVKGLMDRAAYDAYVKSNES